MKSAAVVALGPAGILIRISLYGSAQSAIKFSLAASEDWGSMDDVDPEHCQRSMFRRRTAPSSARITSALQRTGQGPTHAVAGGWRAVSQKELQSELTSFEALINDPDYFPRTHFIRSMTSAGWAMTSFDRDSNSAPLTGSTSQFRLLASASRSGSLSALA